MADTSSNDGGGWKVEERTRLMSRRYEFPSYAEMRDFLDRLAELSESENYYPDLSFGRTHVSVSIRARDDAKGLSEVDYAFSEKVNQLAQQPRQPG